MKTLVLMAGVMALSAVDAIACSCAVPPPKQAFHEAAAVFVGDVGEMEDGLRRVRVLEAFKGVRAGETVNVKWEYGMCSYPLRGETEHLLYAFDEGGLAVHQCSHSRRLSDAACEVQLLRRRARWWRVPLSRIPFESGRAGANPCARR